MTNNQVITIASNAAFASSAHDHVHSSYMPSLEQILILDHVSTLLQYFSHSASKADSKNSTNTSVDDIDDKDIVARINGLLNAMEGMWNDASYLHSASIVLTPPAPSHIHCASLTSAMTRKWQFYPLL